MHGQVEHSNTVRIICTMIHLSFLGIAGWIYFGDGLGKLYGVFGYEYNQHGNLARQIILFSFGIILWIRLSVTLFYLLKRRLDWSECSGVLFAVFLYQIVYAVLGANESRPVDFFDIVGILIFVLGSLLNTFSELQRKWFKDKPENKGRLYTGGFFRFARHINYFGDTLWVTGWAMLTRNIWSYSIPIFITILFIFAFIPSLTQHLEVRYKEQFAQYKQRTKTFVPFIY